jgi:hypothetical protein
MVFFDACPSKSAATALTRAVMAAGIVFSAIFNASQREFTFAEPQPVKRKINITGTTINFIFK